MSAVNFAADTRAHYCTYSQSLTHVVLDLASHPECFESLREEIEPIVAKEGWTRAALGKMWKLDSLLRESQRLHRIGISMSASRPCPACPPRLTPVLYSFGDAHGAQRHHIQRRHVRPQGHACVFPDLGHTLPIVYISSLPSTSYFSSVFSQCPLHHQSPYPTPRFPISDPRSLIPGSAFQGYLLHL